jgi:hypothetical protein
MYNIMSATPIVIISFITRILELCRQISKGITDQVIQNDMPDMDAKDRVMAINRLLSTVRHSTGQYLHAYLYIGNCTPEYYCSVIIMIIVYSGPCDEGTPQ